MDERIAQLRANLLEKTNHLNEFNHPDRSLNGMGFFESREKGSSWQESCVAAIELFCLESEPKVEPNDILAGSTLAPANARKPMFIFGVPREDSGITGHFAPDYAKLMKFGINGLLEEFNPESAPETHNGLPSLDSPIYDSKALDVHFRQVLGGNYEKYAQDLHAPSPREFYIREVRVLRAFQKWIRNHAVETRKTAKKCEEGEIEGIDATSKYSATLNDIAERCTWVAEHPPRDLLDALQLATFTHMLVSIEADLMSLGRPDRWLAPFYPGKDKNGKAITEKDALYWIQAFLLKINEWTVLPQGMIVGGQECTEDGFKPYEHPLSCLILEAHRQLRLVNPAIGISLSKTKGEHEDLLDLAMQCWAEGLANPSIYNDDVISRGLMEAGVEKEDAVDYINCTCTEITPCGASNIWVVNAYWNGAKVLEWALNGGEILAIGLYDQDSGKHVKSTMISGPLDAPGAQLYGEDTPIPGSFRQLVDNFKKQLACLVETNAEIYTRQRVLRRMRIYPFNSLLVRDSRKRYLDISHGGARANFINPQFVGFSTVVDSLSAIQQLVDFSATGDQPPAAGRLSLPQLLELLRHDWKGEYNGKSGAYWREKALAAPHWGNDEEIDELGQEIYEFYVNEVHKYSDPTMPCGRFNPGNLSFIMHGEFGKTTLATADGRREREALSDSFAPVQGRGEQGPTAMINSLSKLDLSYCLGGPTFNLTLAPANLEGDNRVKIGNLVRTFLEKGGAQMQVNVINAGILRDAQEHPENYKHLMVKVAGYTDVFVRLTRQIQDEIITRTKNSTS
ncbi:MAG: pyruvate formate lyase family protein [Candidatus Hodarchaeota archaeon]